MTAVGSDPALSAVEIVFGNSGWLRRRTVLLGALAGGEHGTTRTALRRKLQETDILRHIDVNRFHAAAHAIGLVPETRAARIAQELPPPVAVRLGARPGFQRVEILPLLAHADVRQQQ